MKFNNTNLQQAFDFSSPIIEKQIQIIRDMESDFYSLEEYLYTLGEMHFIYEISEHETLVYTDKIIYHNFEKGFEQSIHKISLPRKVKIYNQIPGFLYALTNFLLCKE